MRTVATKAKDADASMAEAFSDLSAMMEKAKEMVELAKRFEAQTAKSQERNESDDEQFRGCACRATACVCECVCICSAQGHKATRLR